MIYCFAKSKNDVFYDKKIKVFIAVLAKNKKFNFVLSCFATYFSALNVANSLRDYAELRDILELRLVAAMYVCRYVYIVVSYITYIIESTDP